MNEFIWAEIIKRTYDGSLILRLVDSKETVFLPFKLMQIQLRNEIRNNAELPNQIKVRFSNDVRDEEKYPVYTQYYYHQDIGIHKFSYLSIDENLIYFKGEDGCEYKALRERWEVGFEFEKYINDKIITSFNVKVLYNSIPPEIKRLNTKNPYYKKINDIIKDKEVIQSTFNRWICYPNSELQSKLKQYYECENANWVLSYENLLYREIIERISRKDFELSLKYTITNIKINEWIIDKNILIARIYEYYAVISDNIKDIIQYFTLSLEYMEKSPIKKIVLIQTYIDYYTFIATIDKKQKTKEKISILKKDAKKNLSYHLQKRKKFEEIFPALKLFEKYYIILSKIDSFDVQDFNILYKMELENNKGINNIIDLNKLRNLVLATNILKKEFKDIYSFDSGIVELLTKGDLISLINDNSLTIDEIEDYDKNMLEEIFRDEESNREFKGSFAFDINNYLDNGYREVSDKVFFGLIKNIASFLNTNGGKIYIGLLEYTEEYRKRNDKILIENRKIKDNKVFWGVQYDLDYENKNWDTYILGFQDTLRNRLGNDGIIRNIRIIKKQLFKANICILDIEPYKTHNIFVDKTRYFY